MKQACLVLSGKRDTHWRSRNYCYFVKRSHRQIRFEVKIGNHTYEVDEFYGANKGLTVAEIELESEWNFHETKLLGIEGQMTIGITIQT
jgi:CYTH domain-containing protein